MPPIIERGMGRPKTQLIFDSYETDKMLALRITAGGSRCS
jgi:hypothetical protein